MKLIPQIIIVWLYCLLSAADAHAQPRLPNIFGDSMVLQRDVPIRIWGTASPGEQVTVSLHHQKKSARAGENGNWQVTLAPEKAGGPYNLAVTGKKTIILAGVLLGDIWFCSGQSNMEFPVKGWSGVLDADEVVSQALHPQIRLYTVPGNVAALPSLESNEANWRTCSPASIPSFSAVAYFFGRRLQQELNVPIGLINSSWGGTQIESWISYAALKQDSHYKTLMQTIPERSMEQLTAARKQKEDEYRRQLQKNQPDVADSAMWRSAEYDHSKWPAMRLPALWEKLPSLSRLDGVVWFRKTIFIREEDAGLPAVLQLGKIDDNDQTFLNGLPIGTGVGWNVDRRYTAGAGQLKAGKNVIAVRVEDTGGGGGIWGDSSELFMTVNGHQYSLAGDWAYSVQEVMHNKNGIGPNDYPSVLYNGMVHPFGRLNIKGVIWYQGEANANTGYEYRYALPLLINDWRNLFKNGEMPLYFVQLTSFNANNGNSNNGSAWAEIRESQAAALRVSHTGMAVTIDVGDAKDIHPRNKKDVGERLAALALRDTYGKMVMASGPVYQSSVTEGDRVRIFFSSMGAGLAIQSGSTVLSGFEIAGDDRTFYPAEAFIDGAQVTVRCSQVAKPVAVRYAWADDAGNANLCNKEGWPARPFRTDSWPGITVNNRYNGPQQQ
ncbi:sialate O-acetylesterase [Chitinophaga barathri]|uniref:Sialate O-acetylesterase n=2 Tax=Chitinophaga barathri TaxID=1647451 RepID=A0A3N4MNM2_9BACT|nr:sialate O-acetylesterase [Chitinophaga barathri]RPD41249.1 sialate O-acetylesterase [Chitinophaga barathri]